MNRAIAGAIAGCDPVGGQCVGDWRRVIMILRGLGSGVRHDVGPFLAPGFNLLLLNESGQPVRYGKCRGPDNERFGRESTMLRFFAQHDQTKALVPNTWVGGEGVWSVQLTEYIKGPPFEKFLASMPTAAVYRAIDDVLNMTHTLAVTAADHLDSCRSRPIALATECLPYLDRIEGLDRDTRTRLRNALAPLPGLASLPQHGDLWPENVVGKPGAWRLVDFEYYGVAQVPLYDTFHFLRTCARLRGLGDWARVMVSGREGGAASRAIIARAASVRGLTADQVHGAFLYYTVHFTAMTMAGRWHEHARSSIMSQLHMVAHTDPEVLRSALLGEHESELRRD